jgi:hypothetical protein
MSADDTPMGHSLYENPAVAGSVPLEDIHETAAGSYCSSCCPIYGDLGCETCWDWEDDAE